MADSDNPSVPEAKAGRPPTATAAEAPTPADPPRGGEGGRGARWRRRRPAGTDPADGDPPRPRSWRDGAGRWRRGKAVVIAALALSAMMLLHSRIPNAIGNIGSLVQTFLPWFGLLVPVLLVCALFSRSITAVAAVTVSALVWMNLFAGLLVDKTGEGGALTVVSHNVDAENPDPTATARQLMETDADLIALQEMPRGELAQYAATLGEEYSYAAVEGTVGLWSRYPLTDTEPVDLGLGWNRALRTTATVPEFGDMAIYVAHLPSVRVQFRAGFTAGQRDDSANRLARAIADDPHERAILLGDLNGTMNDRSLAPLTSQLRSTQGAAGAGFGFTFPAEFPVTRIDHILVREVEPVSSWSLPVTGSDHRPVAARLDP
ncbi:endonuclease/exonuclease/phosphatase family protein [Streptomyces alkaliphilus]|uniref:endonuclease/exonuclease/phosphatase family protein n=1 Tax=Streptomyces alkaliphilus TaxID=1472722 RepID=UPI00117CEBA2|nr:endonuclease/exonuclease/phosphatase family protein [Streptomyces alkaliphilus]MQS06735.1 hypothetical protein [Streptomyces alkaliphilus]